MRIDSAAPKPTWQALAATIGVVLAATTVGLMPDRAQAAPRSDRWSEAEKATLSSMMLARLPPPPADGSNAVEPRPEAVALGQKLFVDARLSKNGRVACATCHNGPLFTDQHFHNPGVPQRHASRPDRGRTIAVASVLNDEFNCLGRYSDASSDGCAELRFIAADDPRMEGAFKTPGLRNVAERAPYMHAGQFASLEEVVAHYVRSPATTLGQSELARAGGTQGERRPIRLTDEGARDLVAFLRALSDSPSRGHGPTSSRPGSGQP
jgi:cytochrome c peroxidase